MIFKNEVKVNLVEEMLNLHSPKLNMPDLGSCKPGAISPSQFQTYREEASKRIHSSTTIITLKCNDGQEAVIVADRRVSAGISIDTDTAIKIYPVGSHSLVAFSGSLSLIKRILEELRARCGTYKILFDEKEMSPNGQAKILSALLEQSYYFSLYMYLWWNIAEPILVAYDRVDEKVKIFDFFRDGSFQEKDMAGNGCGWESVKGLINKDWKIKKKEKMSSEEAIDSLVRAMYESGELNNFVSNARLAPPTLFTIGFEGIKMMDEQQVKMLIMKKEIENGVTS